MGEQFFFAFYALSAQIAGSNRIVIDDILGK